MEEHQTNKRTRLSVDITAKGLATWGVTAEYDTPEEAAQKLHEAITRCRAVIAQIGLKEAHE